MILTPLLAALAVHAPASLTGLWQYKAFDEKGKTVAHGTMRFRPAKKDDFMNYRSESGWAYFGTRNVTVVEGDKYGPHSGSQIPGEGHLPGAGAYRIGANLKDKAFSADLCEGWSDNNIILNGTLTGKTIKGTWYWATFAGARVKGTFTLTPQSAGKSRKAH